jgi:predicted Zn-dependent peptidase
MHETLVPEEEVEVAKNYILGNFLKTVDGPFAQAELIKLMVLKNMPFDFFNQYLNQIRETSSEQVLQMMNSYLKPDSLAQLVVGK